LLSFIVTEIARHFKSDETILHERINESLQIFESEAFLKEVANIHEYHQMEAERLGEIYGCKLGMKIANPWNFINASLLADRKDIVKIIDESEEIRAILTKLIEAWDELVAKVQYLNFIKVATEIANAKIQKGKDKEVAVEEALKEAVKHPKFQNFRLALNLAFDSRDIKKTALFKVMTMALKGLVLNTRKIKQSYWELLKDADSSC